MIAENDILNTESPRGPIFFRLQGRLGNQLFGLANAHYLSKFYGANVIIDLSDLPSDAGEPEWLKFAEEWDWAIFSNHSKSTLLPSNLIKFVLDESTPLPINPTGILFMGFIPSVEIIQKSGLFQPHIFPFTSLEFQTLEPNSLAVCVRRGDYNSNPHLGILPKKYYVKAFKIIRKKISVSKIIIFTDDVEGTRDFLEKEHINFDDIDAQTSALCALGTLSTASAVICANSTFSFWGAYFAKAPYIGPHPFYLSNKDWNKNLLRSSDIKVIHTHFPIMIYTLNLVKRRITRIWKRLFLKKIQK